MLKIYERKCLVCKDKFTPKNNTQIVCSTSCAVEYMKKQNAKNWKQEKKEIKIKLMSKSDYLNILQKVFNTYIRQRDKLKPCISCGKNLGKTFHAGHFFSVGAYPNLRFNENNVHGQCVECNLHKHGNVKEYDLRLQNVISDKEYNELLEMRHKPLKLSVDEVQELIAIYKQKIKELQ
jgi:hypothetical protein